MDLDKRLYKLQQKLGCIQNSLAYIETDTSHLKSIAYCLSVLTDLKILEREGFIFNDKSKDKIRKQLALIKARSG